MMRRQYVNYMDWNKATKIQNNYSDIYDYQRHNRGAFSASIGINKTSELAGWSNGKDMKELKSSLDTIRRTASELITGIEEQLREIQRDREILQDMSINGQEKESFLLIQNSDLSEYSLVNVRGMDGAELVEALLAMNDNDRLSVAAYLESKGAWTTEIANQDTKEFGEHRLDVRYNTDTNEVIDIKAVMELDERAKEPIGADDVILKITHAGSFEVERVTNKTPEEVQGIVAAVYGHTLSYAMEHGEADEYLESHKLDRECKRAIEETIQQNFDGMHLKHDIVKPLAEQYGSERMAFVLANTLQQESWDGRFSRDNKTWAAEFYIPENIVHGMDMNRELIVSSHPAVLDGFIAMFRREVLEKEKEMSAGQGKTQDTSGYDVNHSEIQNDLKPEPERKQEEQPETKEPEPEQNQPERTEHTQALEDMEDEDEIIDLGDETEQVLAQMKKSLKGEQETELAFQIADRFISIQEVDGGYDYSIMGADYKEIDGGVYDNKSNGVGYDVSIREALDDILTDLRENPFDNGTRGNIRDNDEWIPIDYDGLMEKAEAVNRIEPQAQGNVVESFKAKTDELFHEISEMNPAEIEETVKCHVQAQLDQYGMDAEIVDVAVVGSRCRGLEREGSDLDVVVELFTSEREDVLFDTFNGDALQAAIATEGK